MPVYGEIDATTLYWLNDRWRQFTGRTLEQEMGELAFVRILFGGRRAHLLTRQRRIVKCWGKNSAGQLGDGTTTTSATPKNLYLTHATAAHQQIAAGGNHTCGWRGSNLYCWGSNGDGELGTTLTAAFVNYPTPVVGLP